MYVGSSHSICCGNAGLAAPIPPGQHPPWQIVWLRRLCRGLTPQARENGSRLDHWLVVTAPQRWNSSPGLRPYETQACGGVETVLYMADPNCEPHRGHSPALAWLLDAADGTKMA
ncbi:hypothetical protein BP6252_01115 [Coleophoma cylindrospora]|uniref:Uncharacterized protein n=1 Tax=Coleophoma cylindrospora TaxID=1849047 RepID=A0A3D8SRZ2_9HELO|nr:hypothetical protein BP6252_01115 [Coleophoma cylindrospora]